MSEKSLYTSLQDLSGARWTEGNHVGDVIDYDLLRVASEQDIALPTAGDTERDKYHGALVGTPIPGVHRNVCYPDYSSLYPNVMRDVNASPETVVGVGARALVRSEYDRDELRWSYVDPRPVKRLSDGERYTDYVDGEYKMVYDPQKNDIKWRDDWERVQEHLEPIYFVSAEIREGILPSRADTYIKWNKSYEGTMYKATKRQRNGLYGVSGDNNFRLFDWRVAEAICIGGRLLLEYGEETLIDRLSSVFSDDAVYKTHSDTDGMGIAVDQDVTRGHVLPRVRETVEWLNDTGMPEFVEEQFGVPVEDTHHAVDVESYAPKLFIPDDGDGGVKKTYVERITWDEGEEVDDLDITGFESKRRDISDVTEDVQEDVLESIVYETRLAARETVYERVREAVDRIHSGAIPLEDLGDRSGMTKPPEEYGTPNRRAHPTYRGAKYAKQHIDGENMEGSGVVYKYPIARIEDEDLPRVYDTETAESGDRVDYISVEDPDNLPDGVVVDRDELVEKLVQNPLDNVFRAMGWEWDAAIHDHDQATFAAYETG